MLSISASVHAGGLTVLHWSCGASQRAQAVSNVDFRYLAGLGNLETAQANYLLVMSLGPDEQPLSAEEAWAAKWLPASGRPSFVLLNGKSAEGKEAATALHAMEALLDYFETSQDELVKQYAQREQERAAQELAKCNAPPPGPKHTVLNFWPINPKTDSHINNFNHKKEAKQP